ncbi:DUF2784 domain-containing protein [bacterium]|nr:DUF2784 domain-containing protein [candidate division CSSED10-310 bacterium]
MIYRLAANTVMILHLIFILYVILGWITVFFYKHSLWFHLPAVLWGIGIELFGWICPLTPLENMFRKLAGESGDHDGFMERMLTSLIYPMHMTRSLQLTLAILVIGLNVTGYTCVYMYYSRKRC